MAIVMNMVWEGVTPQQYDDLRTAAGWLEEPPVGGRIHVAAFDDGGVRITDVWDSAEELQAFVETRLMPAVQQVGIPGQPQMEFLPLHELYVPKPDNVLTT